MIKSMTGFGRAEYLSDEINIIVEVKSLNSKYLDALIKMPKAFSEKEIEIRGLLEKNLSRGKISLNIDYQNKIKGSQPQVINQKLFEQYYTQLKTIADNLSDERADIFRLAMYLPDVISPDVSGNSDIENWDLLKGKITEAVNHCDEFRCSEGSKLMDELTVNINQIDEYLIQIAKLDPERAEHIQTRLHNNLAELIPEGEYDKNRFEQELIYYLEKLDINEEKVRLKSHLDYFLSELNLSTSNGKKLNFISQEIGREINTIGSKANYAPITKIVVLMKDNLEKIKEQLLNIL